MQQEIEDRRQRAREAFYDGSCAHIAGSECFTGIESAIEAAMRVRITDEVIEAFGEAWHARQMSGVPLAPGRRREAGLRAAFEAAGFEVVEEV